MPGKASGYIWLTSVECNGNEMSLLECNHTLFGNSSCSHHQDVGVLCGVEDLRLADGFSNSSGRLEVLFKGEWGTVCHHGWSTVEVTVVCRQLGYSAAILTYSSGIFGKGSGRIWLLHVECTGSEMFLLECQQLKNPLPDCSHQMDVDNVIKGIRLAGGFSTSSGRLEVLMNGEWGTVCHHGWSVNNAHVVCSQLGYSGAAYTFTNGIYGEGSGFIWLTDVECIGNETSLSECKNGKDLQPDCSHRKYAGVFCASTIIDVSRKVIPV
ncbi:Neurotrypsin [Holothuria leucospilota]|uniref:Neurotrypsin n=1 Tax=Holothuria leucospilota TaxID=206669 RepID=A0A9Q1H6D4_HOLLE|nr:Neurotrypsin [Holothuria leucospilota]